MTTRRTLIMEALKAHGGRLSYRKLRKETGIPEGCFSAFIHHFTKEGLIHSEGTRFKRVIILGPPATPLPESLSSGSPEQKKPEFSGQTQKERKCLRCRERLISSWSGHRLCKRCRATNATVYEPAIQNLPYGTGRER